MLWIGPQFWLQGQEGSDMEAGETLLWFLQRKEDIWQDYLLTNRETRKSLPSRVLPSLKQDCPDSFAPLTASLQKLPVIGLPLLTLLNLKLFLTFEPQFPSYTYLPRLLWAVDFLLKPTLFPGEDSAPSFQAALLFLYMPLSASLIPYSSSPSHLSRPFLNCLHLTSNFLYLKSPSLNPVQLASLIMHLWSTGLPSTSSSEEHDTSNPAWHRIWFSVHCEMNFYFLFTRRPHFFLNNLLSPLTFEA